MLKGHQKPGKAFGEVADSAGHIDESHEQHAEAAGYVSHVLVGTSLGKHYEPDAYDESQRCQIIRLEEVQDTVFGGFQVHKSDDLSRYGGSDVGAEHDAYRLPEREESGAYEYPAQAANLSNDINAEDLANLVDTFAAPTPIRLPLR